MARSYTRLPDVELEHPETAIRSRAEIIPAKAQMSLETEGCLDSDSSQPEIKCTAKRQKIDPKAGGVEFSATANIDSVSTPIEISPGAEIADAPILTKITPDSTAFANDTIQADETMVACFTPTSSWASTRVSRVSRSDNASSLDRYLTNRQNAPVSRHIIHPRHEIRGNERPEGPQANGNPLHLPGPKPTACVQPAGIELPSNPPEITHAIASVEKASASLEAIPIMMNNEIYNKRPLICALDHLSIQLHGHDSLEVDFILDPRTGCLYLPLAALPSTVDQLIDRAFILASRFEHLIFIFALYPDGCQRTKNAILPNPWSKAVQESFNVFKGRLGRWVALQRAHADQDSPSHQVDIYLSESAKTLAALLRLELEKSQMPSGPADFSRCTTAFGKCSREWLASSLTAVKFGRSRKTTFGLIVAFL